MTEQERTEAFQVELGDLLRKYGVELHAILTQQGTEVNGNEITVKLAPAIQIKALPLEEPTAN